ncbi:MAG: hypothetical protein VX667_00255 [Nitrospinota bacterium]|nr:hypothetical protein [Nitrospinota bacterium]
MSAFLKLDRPVETIGPKNIAKEESLSLKQDWKEKTDDQKK